VILEALATEEFRHKPVAPPVKTADIPPPAPKPPPLQPAPMLSAAPPAALLLPAAPPAASPRRPPEGFLFGAGLTFSYALTPTVSLGGIGSLVYRRDPWSGALEARVDHSLVPAHFPRFPIESLFAGATLVLPCAHEGAFSGCFVTDVGGFAFSAATGAPLGGSPALLAFGLRMNFERAVGEHLLARGSVQISAIPVGAHLKVFDEEVWRSQAGFASVGLTFLVTP
jgi:hypothetical protein